MTVIGGIDDISTEKALSFYQKFVKGKLHKTNAKLLRCVNLLKIHQEMFKFTVNELSLICDKRH